MLKKLIFASTCALAGLCFLSERTLAQLEWRCATDGFNQAYASTQQEAYNKSLSLCASNTLPAAGEPSPCRSQNVVCQQTGLQPQPQPQPQPPRPQPPQPQPPQPSIVVGDANVPSTTVFNNRLVALALSTDGRIYITQTDAKWKWNSQWTEVPGNARTGFAPAVAVFNNRLVVLIKGYGYGSPGSDDRIYITQTNANWNWNSRWTEVPGNGRISGSPAIAVFNNRLVAVVIGTDARIYITQTDANWNWNPGWTEVPGNGNSWDLPAVAVFNNRLVVLASRYDRYTYITQTDANWNWNPEWTRIPGTSLGSGGGASAPAVAVFNNRLVQYSGHFFERFHKAFRAYGSRIELFFQS